MTDLFRGYGKKRSGISVKLGLGLVLLLLTHTATAKETAATAATAQSTVQLATYVHTKVAYPPVFFVTNIEDAEFKDKLDTFAAFENLDEKAVGLPIGLRILKLHRTKQDGTQFTSLMLSASTLGLIPVVSNTEFKVRYDIFVQGKSIADFEYLMDSTDVNNIWTSAYQNREVKPSEEVFLKDTLAQFLTELQSNEKAQSVFAEYREFFPAE